MRRVLVTGAGGFVGRHVVAALAGRAEVVPATIDGRRADLLDPAARAALADGTEADTLIHLAWVTEHGQFWASPLNAAWEAATADLFGRFYAAGGRRIVGTGSCAEYDWSTGAARFHENAALRPHTEYGAAKVRTGERLAGLAGQRQASWAWARIFFSFGAGEPVGRLVPLMLRAVATGEPLEIGPGRTTRDFMPIEALGQAIAALALSDVEGPVNTASGVATRFDDLARMIERLAGVDGVILPDRRALGPAEPEALVADTTRLRDEVGFRTDAALEHALRAGLGHV